MNATPQQQAVIARVRALDSNLLVEAGPGSGKTTTLEASARALPESTSILYCAFNKRIAVAAEGRMPPNVKCRTINSIGHGAVIQNNGRPELAQFKAHEIVKQMGLRESFPDAVTALNAARSAGLVPQGAPGSFVPLVEDTPENWRELLTECEIDTGSASDPIGALRAALTTSIRQAWKGKIDFLDQIYMPTLFHWSFPKFDAVFVDEAQDLSPLDQEMLRQVARSAPFVAIGDRFQSIYGFRGADFEAMASIESKFNASVLPLSVSFRCPKAVIREAQRYVPGISAFESNPEGTVEHLPSFEPSTFGPGDVILCRNNWPLVSLALRLLAAGVPVKVLGRDIGEGLVKLCRKIPFESMADFLPALRTHVEHAARDFEDSNKPGKAASLQDRLESIGAIAAGVRTKTALVSKISDMFSDKSSPITLSTIHKAKGLEWDRVFFLDSWLIPSKHAKSASDFQQESNAAYIAITRTKQSLFYINTRSK